MEQNQVTEREDPGITPHLATPVKHPSCAPAPSRFLRTVAVIWTYLVSGAHHKLLTLHSRLSFRRENQVMLKLLQTTDNRSTFHLLHKVNCQRFPHWLQSHITHLAQRQRHLSAKPSVIRRSAKPFAQLCGVKSVKNGNLTRSSLTLQFPWWTFIYLFFKIFFFKSNTKLDPLLRPCTPWRACVLWRLLLLRNAQRNGALLILRDPLRSAVKKWAVRGWGEKGEREGESVSSLPQTRWMDDVWTQDWQAGWMKGCRHGLWYYTGSSLLQREWVGAHWSSE